MNQQSVLDRQNDMMALMVEQRQASLLPPLMLSKFSGDPIEYNTFIRRFESQIKRRLSSNHMRLRYLEEQYLESERKDLIKGCLHVDANKGYLEAKNIKSQMLILRKLRTGPMLNLEAKHHLIVFLLSLYNVLVLCHPFHI